MAEPGRVGAFGQTDADVRFEWGPVGAGHLGPDAGCLVVVDVLSFTTSVSICVSRGMAVFPHRWDAAGALAFADERGAKLAVRRRDVSAEHPWSLSPAVLSRAPVTPRLVLPSPNGSTIAAAASSETTTVVAGSLRNAGAVGRWLIDHDYGVDRRPVVVIGAGERWPDGSLRPALEDALGAGAVLRHLQTAGRTLSVEAAATAGQYGATVDVEGALRSSGSARHLVGAGYGDDVDVAAELDRDESVAVLRDGAFIGS